MRIPAFNIQNQRALRLAACENVPPVMIVTGPNGCGKSTLLNSLRQVGGGQGPILYIGPHRTSRRQSVRMRYLAQQRVNMGTLLSSPNLPGYEGMNLPSQERDAWNFDEAQSFLKYSLCNIEMDRSEAITKRFDKDGIISRESLPDVWQPLRDMTQNLLPHLSFERIDMSNRDQIRCLWRVHNKDIFVDIDDLSSGEKAIVQLFFPLIEQQIQARVAQIGGEEKPLLIGTTAVLLDEPELHLHPNIQGKILEYIRGVSLAGHVQFILATHSPTIVEQANSNELYLLRPGELLGSDTNQLVQIATDDEKLQMVRETFGSMSNVTALRRVLIVEGQTATDSSKRSSDSRVYGFLSDRFGQLTIVPGGGKNECKALVKRLSDVLSSVAPRLRAVALLDRDLEEVPSSKDVMFLPVSMIENLLVDPVVIWNALATVHHKITLNGVSDVDKALDTILESLTDSEVVRRTKFKFGIRTFRLSDPISEAKRQVDDFTNMLLREFDDGMVQKASQQAVMDVKKISSETKRREHFDGKAIFNEFYKAHVHSTGMSKEIFVYGCAKEASKRQSVSKFVDTLFVAIGIDDPLAEPVPSVETKN